MSFNIESTVFCDGGRVKPIQILDCNNCVGSGYLYSDGTTMQWCAVPAPGIPTSCITGKGALVSGTAANTPTALSVGTDGQVLTACAACPTGLTWAAGGGGGGSPATPTVAGTVLGCTVQFNTSLGCNAFASLTTGSSNVALGRQAACRMTSGTSNTAVGDSSLFNVIDGRNNTAVGSSAMLGTTGWCNTAVGSDAMLNLKTGCWNTSLGYQALRSSSNPVASNNGFHNVAIGASALSLSDTSCCNVAVGSCALLSTSSGLNNTAVGFIAGCAITSGNFNVVVGSGQQVPNASGSCQLAIGWGTGCWMTGCSTGAIRPAAGIMDCAGGTGTAGQVLTSNGANAVCWGAVSLPAATPSVAGAVFGRTGGGAVGIGEGIFTVSEPLLAVAVGCQALAKAQLFAQQNTALGNQAGFELTTGQGNTLVGSRAGCTITTGSGNIAFSPNNAGLTIAPVFSLTTQCNRVVMGSTSVTNAYIQVAWTAVSDARDKTNVTALPVGLDFVNQLNPVSYQFKENRESPEAYGPVRYGFLAQEVLEAEGEDPVIVDVEDTEKLKITYDHMNAVLVKAIQELSAKNDALEARIAQLENS